MRRPLEWWSDMPDRLSSTPLVSIGMPVYNGENFVADALESIVSQTYENLEIVVGDNASEDATEEICREFANKDDRVKYVRHDRNMGASANHDFVFFNSTGPLFKLAAHDDMIHPQFVEKCVAALTERPDYVLAYSRVRHIDEAGREHEEVDRNIRRMHSPNPALRFGHITAQKNRATPVFGVFRREAVRSDTILDRYVGSDRALLAELALAGPWHRVDEFLFFRREHSTTSTNAFRRELDRIRWFDPGARGAVRFPNWRRMAELARVIGEADLSPANRVLAYTQLGRWLLTPLPIPRVVRLLRDPLLALMAARSARQPLSR